MWRWFSVNVGDDVHFARSASGPWPATSTEDGFGRMARPPRSATGTSPELPMTASPMRQPRSATDKRDRVHELRGDVLRVYGVPHKTGDGYTVVNEGLARWTYEERTATASASTSTSSTTRAGPWSRSNDARRIVTAAGPAWAEALAAALGARDVRALPGSRAGRARDLGVRGRRPGARLLQRPGRGRLARAATEVELLRAAGRRCAGAGHRPLRRRGRRRPRRQRRRRRVPRTVVAGGGADRGRPSPVGSCATPSSRRPGRCSRRSAAGPRRTAQHRPRQCLRPRPHRPVPAVPRAARRHERAPPGVRAEGSVGSSATGRPVARTPWSTVTSATATWWWAPTGCERCSIGSWHTSATRSKTWVGCACGRGGSVPRHRGRLRGRGRAGGGLRIGTGLARHCGPDALAWWRRRWAR